MTELLTAAQMRAIEQAAIASGEVTGLELMERAGRGVVEAIFEEWPELKATSHRAVVLCGPGNNGGDGFVVARLLKEWGWEVEVFLYGEPEKMPPDARVNYERWVGMGDVRPLSDTKQHESKGLEVVFDAALVVDALFGIGINRAAPYFELLSYVLHQSFRDAVWWHGEQADTRFIAIDMPSGVCADSGVELADEQGQTLIEPYAGYLTVTFHRPKLGHFLAEAPWRCGKLKVMDLGLKDLPWEAGRFYTTSKLVEPPEYLSPLCFVDRSVTKPVAAHKYSHGHALVLSGPSGRGGAARLAARGALRIGAGVVTVGCPHEALPENAARLDAVMLVPVHNAKELSAVLSDTRINAICLGPGMGTGAREAGFLAVALRRVGNPPKSGARGQTAHPTAVVLDADALTILSQNPDLFAALHEGCVLTPHAGEFARLFPDIAAKLAAPATKGPAYSKVDAAREAAKRAGCVVLYKGPDTVIADPTGRCAVNSAHYDRAAPWLATAGSGDVLSGFITGLLARGFSPFDAACTGAWLHVECALSFGPGLIAEDLPEELPKVFRALGM